MGGGTPLVKGLEIAASVIKSVSPVKYSTGSSWSVRDSSVIFFAHQFFISADHFHGENSVTTTDRLGVNKLRC